MIVVHVAAAAFGVILVTAVLISALETVVLPRNGFTRIARFVFAVADRILVHPWKNKDREANLRGLYAPVALVSLPLVWMLSVTFGFSFVFWAISHDTAPVDEREAEGDREHPDQGQADQRHRGVEATQVGLAVPCSSTRWTRIAVGHGEDEPGDAGEAVPREHHRLEGRDEYGRRPAITPTTAAARTWSSDSSRRSRPTPRAELPDVTALPALPVLLVPSPRRRRSAGGGRRATRWPHRRRRPPR